MNKQLQGYITLESVTAMVENNTIYIPTIVEHVDLCEYHGDARSFGYLFDDGLCTIVHYEAAVGVLAEDTLDLFFQSKNKPHAPSVGSGAIEPFEFPDEEFNSWQKNLDTSWAEKRYAEWESKGLIDDDETKEKWIADKLDCYHSWPAEWVDAYKQDKKEKNQPLGTLETIVKYDELTLSRDENGDYFFSTKYFDYGYLTKADKNSALEYIDFYHVFCEQNKAHKRLLAQINENILLLMSVER